MVEAVHDVSEEQGGELAEPLTLGRIAARWFGVLGPLGAAFTQQQLAYLLTSAACHGSVLFVHLPAFIAIVILVLAVIMTRKENDDGFFFITGMLSAVVAVILILAQWLPTFFISPCQR
jgi:hypothetical protein